MISQIQAAFFTYLTSSPTFHSSAYNPKALVGFGEGRVLGAIPHVSQCGIVLNTFLASSSSHMTDWTCHAGHGISWSAQIGRSWV